MRPSETLSAARSTLNALAHFLRKNKETKRGNTVPNWRRSSGVIRCHEEEGASERARSAVGEA